MRPWMVVRRGCALAAGISLACEGGGGGTSGGSETTGSESGGTTTTTSGSTTTTTDDVGTSTATSGSETTTSSESGGSTGGSTSDTTSDTTSGGSSTSETGGAVDLDGWTKRRDVLIDNQNDDALVDHEIAVDLEIDEDMNGNLSDLRFTDAAGTELLPHWLEVSVPADSFRAWVRVPQVPASDVGVISMWYGNPDAEDVSDPAATFHFWDGFDGAALTDTWMSNGEHAIAGGVLTITNGTVYSVEPLTDGSGWVAEARIRWPGQDTNDAYGTLAVGDGLAFGPSADYVRMYRGGGINTLSADAAVAGVSVFGQNNIPTPYTVDAFAWMRVGTGPSVVRVGWGHAPELLSGNLDTPAVTDEALYMWLGEAGALGVITPGDIFDVEVDAVLLRRFETIRPTTSQGPEDDV